MLVFLNYGLYYLGILVAKPRKSRELPKQEMKFVLKARGALRTQGLGLPRHREARPGPCRPAGPSRTPPTPPRALWSRLPSVSTPAFPPSRRATSASYSTRFEMAPLAPTLALAPLGTRGGEAGRLRESRFPVVHACDVSIADFGLRASSSVRGTKYTDGFARRAPRRELFSLARVSFLAS